MPSLTLAAWRLALALAVAPALAAAVDASDGTESVGTAVAGGAPVTPVFVSGCGHSGTSVMLRLIGAHKAIYMFNNETCALCRIGRGLAPGEAELDEVERSRRRLEALELQYRAERTATERRWVEKTPLHVRYMDKLFTLRPNARVVLMVRDGRDVVASFKGRAKPEFAENAVHNGALRWIHDTKLAVSWAQHPSVLVVRYERLVRHTSPELDRLFDFLGERFREEDILAFWAAQQSFNGLNVSARTSFDDRQMDHETLRAAQFNSPLYDGTGRFKLPGHRGLSSEDWAVLERVDGFTALQQTLGYNTPNSR